MQAQPTTFTDSSDEIIPTRPQGVLRGPSDGVEAWTRYVEARVDWLIDARGRWHDHDPPQRTPGWRLIWGAGVGLLAAIALAERLLGG